MWSLRVKNAPRLGSHVFQANVTIFELIQDIIETNLLTKHEDWTIHVASRVKYPAPWWPYIIGKNLLTKLHEDRKINVAFRVLTRKNAPPPGGHAFKATNIILEVVQDNLGMNLLTKFHEHRTINVASRVLTRFCNSHILPFKENAPPLGIHVFQANVTIFKLIQDIFQTNVLTKFHEDWTINVASVVLTRQMLTPHDARRTTDKRRSQKHTMSTLCSGELKTADNSLMEMGTL
ncbi:hypothetical protein DPMN_137612 [Dreissena polymorpha]|uniref:Uncharacterized protein n=1 Tax=Dreissena polymorpha TaxID=45954 RepID=A0A9D4G2V2_DREPO|nr:hypothetical protein DPMN_137612 [Dreissena polymorpha]